MAIEGDVLELVNGLLLGDGGIRFDKGPPILSITNKSEEYLKFIWGILPCCPAQQARPYEAIHQRMAFTRTID